MLIAAGVYVQYFEVNVTVLDKLVKEVVRLERVRPGFQPENVHPLLIRMQKNINVVVALVSMCITHDKLSCLKSLELNSSSSMADQQKIHSVEHADIESPLQASPTAPVGTTKADHVNPVEEHEPNNSQVTPPKPPKKRRSCCSWSLCWTWTWSILLLLFIIWIIIYILFLVFRQKLPNYSIDRLDVTQFNLSSNSSLSARFQVHITARNPSRRIGVYYGGSPITVSFSGTELSEGSLPKFYQGHRNKTVMVLPMSGQIQNGTGLLVELQQQQQAGNITLLLRSRQPVWLKLGSLKVREMKLSLRCQLGVAALSPNISVSFSSSGCSFRFRLYIIMLD
ncbi:hypothetical protein V6N13_075349 [Hibiscus sabdariffa]